MKTSNCLALRLAVVFVIFATLLAGCSGKPASTASGGAANESASKPAGEPAIKTVSETTVKVTVLQGVQDIPLKIMEQQGIAAKHKLKIDKRLVASPEAGYLAMKTSDFEIDFGGWPSIAQLRDQGYKPTNVYSVMSFSNEILVKKDSPLQGIADLKGQRVGLFGGPSATTTMLFRMEALRFFEFDPLKQAKLHYGAPALLSGMLDRGDLDAILLLEPVSTQLLSKGDYRSIGNIGKIWEQKTGEHPMLVCVVVNETWAEANPDVVKRFLAAFKESIEYLKNHDDIWPTLAETMGIKTEAGAKLLHQQINAVLMNEWNQGLIDEQYKFFTEIRELFPDVEGIPKAIPAGTFNLKYAP